jgi:hypothetical protein
MPEKCPDCVPAKHLYPRDAEGRRAAAADIVTLVNALLQKYEVDQSYLVELWDNVFIAYFTEFAN